MLKLQAASLDWALEHASTYGDTDIFPPLFEYRAMRAQWATLRATLQLEDVQAWVARTPRVCLVPKARFAFRVASQLDPLDSILYAACVYEIGTQIEARRVPTGDNRVFSWRFAPESDGRMYDPAVGYANFQSESKRLIRSGDYGYVVVTDISDFYQRIYHHRLENALAAAAPSRPHTRAIMNLLRVWSDGASYGLPVGPAPSRLLAELVIADVDDSLLGDGVRFVRFNDDYRIFVYDKTEGYRILSALAKRLYDMHGLTLQAAKTNIVPADEFAAQFLLTDEDRELVQLRARFHAIAESLGLASEYEDINIGSLTEEQQQFVESLNLAQMFREEMGRRGEPDYSILRFALRRAAQVGDTTLIDDILSNMEKLYPIFDTCIAYLKGLTNLAPAIRKDIGRRVLELLNGTVVSELEFHRLWALDLFTDGTNWDNVDQMQILYNRFADQGTRRALILGMGRGHQSHWFTANKNSFGMLPPWEQRAFLAAASCMAPDATRHWYRSLESRVDILGRAIIEWANAHPFRA